MISVTGRMNGLSAQSPESLDDALNRLSLSVADGASLWSDQRLAILRTHNGGTSCTPQPIFNEDRSLLIVMSGHVSDYASQRADLIRRGHVFRFENDDAEYCLHLYEEKGERAFADLNGSFLIVIYDVASGELLLISDRFGSHPLFYRLNSAKGLLFSTQIGLIALLSNDNMQLDMEAVIEFFALQRVLGAKTFYCGVRLLEPATILRYRRGHVTQARYWEMRYSPEDRPKAYFADALAEAVKASVDRSMKRDLRYGVLLSGGLDSRMILAAADKDLTAITFCDVENREVRTARRLARAKGCRHVVLTRPPDHYADLVDSAVAIGGGMYAFAHAHTIGFSKEIRNACDVVLHGFAPELLFRGTTLPRRKRGRLRRAIAADPLLELSNDTLADAMIRKLKYSMYKEAPQQLFAARYASEFDQTLRHSVSTMLAETGTRATDVYDRFTWPDIYYGSRYPSYLFQMSIRSFADERAPLMHDNDLLDLHLRMPVRVRCGSEVWMKAMAKLDPRIAAVPDANTGLPWSTPRGLAAAFRGLTRLADKAHLSRSDALPDSTCTQGSWPNYSNLIRCNEKLRTLIGDTIEDPACLSPEVFALERIREMFCEHLSGDCDHWSTLFLLLTFGRWQKSCGL